MRLDLALVLCGRTLTSGPPRSRHASLRRTGHRRNRSAPIFNYQTPTYFVGHSTIQHNRAEYSRTTLRAENLSEQGMLMGYLGRNGLQRMARFAKQTKSAHCLRTPHAKMLSKKRRLLAAYVCFGTSKIPRQSEPTPFHPWPSRFHRSFDLGMTDPPSSRVSMKIQKDGGSADA